LHSRPPFNSRNSSSRNLVQRSPYRARDWANSSSAVLQGVLSGEIVAQGLRMNVLRNHYRFNRPLRKKQFEMVLAARSAL